MIQRGQVTVTLTPELRQLALAHVRVTHEDEELELLTRWFQEQETPDGYVLDTTSDPAEAHMIVVIARALLWEYERCPECRVLDPVVAGHEQDCSYRDNG